jgi:hypothetical protein
VTPVLGFGGSYQTYLSLCPFEDIEKYAGYRGDLLGIYYKRLYDLGLTKNTHLNEDFLQWLENIASYAVGTECGRAALVALTICAATSPSDPLCGAFVAGAAEVCSYPEVRYEGQ